MFVVDANIVIAALLKDSKTRQIIVSGKFELASPDYLLEELEKNKNYITKKAKISIEEFQIVTTLLLRHIKIIPHEEYKDKLVQAKKDISNDVNDVAYVACYLSFNCEGIWTNDFDFENKEGIKTFNTAHLLKLM